MKVTDTTKRALKYRRERRDMRANGWEYVGEGGGPLWELQRGGRYYCIIKEVQISADGKGLWVKIEEEKTKEERAAEYSAAFHKALGLPPQRPGAPRFFKWPPTSNAAREV